MTNTQQPQALAATPLSDIHGPLAGTVADFAPTSASYRVGFMIPEGLHPNTATLVRDFAEAMAKKLRASEVKHGWTANWMRKDWRDELAAELLRHVHKGDPIDVAAYAAFAWFHGWSVAPAEVSATSGGQGGTEALNSVLAEVAAERRRQIEEEGNSNDQDDGYTMGELVRAAVSYIKGFPESWPWGMKWWKPKDERRNLIRALALLTAEVERIDRAVLRQSAGEGSANG